MPTMTDKDVVEVLHIDDNPGDLDLTRAAFLDCCPEVRYLGIDDPREGVAYLIDHAAAGMPPPSLVVLDLNMPGIRGQQILAMIRRHSALRDLPVAVLTTSTRGEEVEECHRLGASAVFTKPPDYAALVVLAKAMLALVV